MEHAVTDLHEELRHALSAKAMPDAPPVRRLIPDHVSKPAVMASSIALLALIGYVDRATGPELHFSLFYVIPVLLATWFIGRRAGFLMSFVSAGARLFVELTGHAVYSRPIMAYWNTGTRLCVFLAAAALLAAFKDLSARLETMVEDRTRALRQLASELSDAEDSERRRLAHALDVFQQSTPHQSRLAGLVAASTRVRSK